MRSSLREKSEAMDVLRRDDRNEGVTGFGEKIL